MHRYVRKQDVWEPCYHNEVLTVTSLLNIVCTLALVSP